MKKKFTLFFIAVFVFVFVYQVFPRNVFAAELTGANIITNVQITNTDGSALGTSVAKDAQIHLVYTFAIPNRSDVHAGDTYTVTASVPQQIKIESPIPFTINDSDTGTLIANGVLDTSGNITITFADFPAEYSNVHGSFWFDLQFNKDKIGNTNPQDIVFNIGGTSPQVTIHVNFEQPAPPVASIVKSGALSASNEITWTLTVDPENVAITGAQVVDKIPAGQSFVSGSVTLGGLAADTANYTYDGTSTFTYNFPADITSQQVITFKTKITDSQFSSSTQDSTLHEGNTATLNHDGISVVSNAATVEVPVNFISKSGVYDSDNKKIDWEIDIDQVNIAISNAVVTDTLPSGLSVVLSSLKADGVAVADPGSCVSGQTITYNFGSISSLHKLTFSTTVDSVVYHSNGAPSYSNTAQLTGTGVPTTTTSPAKVDVPSIMVKKSGAGYNAATHQIKWQITANANKISIDHAVITDNIPTGQQYVDNSATISGSPTGAFSYSPAAGDPSKTGTLIYNFTDSGNSTGTIDQEYVITYYTTVTDANVYANNYSGTYYNTASFDGSVGGSSVPTSQDTGSQSVQSHVISKTGTGYDYQTRQVSWNITVNANQMALGSVVVTDNIPTGQQFVAGSAAIDVGATGSFSYQDTPDDSSKTGTLTYTFASSISQTYHITFKTTVTDLTIFKTNGDQTIQNNAAITDDLVPGGVTTNGSQIVHNTVIGKSASYTAGNRYIDWSVTINTNNIPLSANEITDQFQAGLALDTTSIKLYHQTVNADGSQTKGAEIPLPDDGNNVKYDLSTSTLHFVIPNPVAGCYLLTFRTDVTDKTKSPFTNAATFSGTGSKQTGTSQSTAVSWANSGSSGTGEVGSITITKLDSKDSSKKLQGAIFELFDKFNNVVQQQTTDSNGTALFSRLRFDVNYTIVELTPPTGYLKTDNPYKFQISGASGDPKDLFYAYTDDQITGNIQFAKTDGTNLLAGAVFTLYNAGNNAIATATSGADGIVLFKNVSYGNYTIKETTPPAGHFTSTDVLTASIQKDGDTVTPNESTVVDIPYKGNIQLTKISSSNVPLAGAVFTLYRQTDTSYTAPVSTATSDSTGLAEFKNIPYGDYAIRETTPPKGYLISNTVLTASITQDGKTVSANPATFSDQIILGKLRVTKISSFDQNPLAGCTFSLYSQNDTSFSNPLASAISDANGIAEFDNVPYGNYTVRETNPPTGYFISDKVLNASITQDGVTVTANPDSIADPPYLGSIQLIKTAADGQTLLSGAVFTLYKASDTAFSTPIAMATSGSNGVALFKDIPYGSYAIKETDAPAGYRLNHTILQVQITQNGQTVNAGSLSDTPEDAKSPATGDNILDYVLVLAICATAISLLLISRKISYRAKH